MTYAPGEYGGGKGRISVPCSECGGSGWAMGLCAACEGHGYVMVSRSELEAKEPKVEE